MLFWWKSHELINDLSWKNKFLGGAGKKSMIGDLGILSQKSHWRTLEIRSLTILLADQPKIKISPEGLTFV